MRPVHRRLTVTALLAATLLASLTACSSESDDADLDTGATETTQTREASGGTEDDDATGERAAEKCVDQIFAELDGVDYDDPAAVAALDEALNGLADTCSAVESDLLGSTLRARMDELDPAAQQYLLTGSTTTTSPPLADATGAPCVPLADPLPAGAPEVTVPVGPPPTELVVDDVVQGDGAEVTAGATVEVDYLGVACSTGTVFDNSYDRGATVEFPLDGVIAGWSQGLLGMKVGGTRQLVIPPDLAYGDAGSPGAIAPGETLVFVVELRSVS